jgi:phosphonate degradation associated HDIG domain protein
MTLRPIKERVGEIFAMYDSLGAGQYVGEKISLLEHMSQSAQLAVRAGADAEVILAAFFHDIGHMCIKRSAENDMDGLGTIMHEKVGADYLRRTGFPERIAILVENHVQAKRYLTARHPEYYRTLSPASKQTLALQGGPMSEAEARSFETSPHFESSIQLRKWDEQAKRIQVPIIDLNAMMALAEKVLKQASDSRPTPGEQLATLIPG